MNNSVLTTTTLADQVEARILEYIEKNNLVPGDMLPNELQFSEKLGVSRNVVREAMSRLRMLGLLQSRTKKGIQIQEPPLLIGFERVTNPRLLSVNTIKKLMGMRIALEIGITDFIFANINNSDIEELEQILTRQQALDMAFWSVESEKEFHSKIYSIAGNDFISQFQELMHPVFVFAKANYDNLLKPINIRLEEQGETVNHQDLFNFLKDRNQEGYRLAIKKHLATYWEFLNQAVSNV